ncbi:MAG: dipeptidase [Actinomycetota bacterium]
MPREDLAHLLRDAPLIDGHNDLLWALRSAHRNSPDEPQPDLREPYPVFMTDLPRMHAGGVGGQFWSVYVPSDLSPHEAVTQTLEQIDGYHRLVARYPEHLGAARTADDVQRVCESGRVASMVGVEGGQSIGCSLGALRMLARLGAGYMTLTHNDDTPWADSATGDRAHGGLTPFGEEVVREMNRLGMLVDCSHVSDDVMRRAIEVSDAPVVFSHSSARALADVPRNVPDDVLDLVGRTGGVVMVAFVPWFVTEQGAAISRAGLDVTRRLRKEYPGDPLAVEKAIDEWFAEQGEVEVTPANVADHIDHVREVAGIDAIGIGGDYDGVPTMGSHLSDVSTYPLVFAELRDRGYADEELQQIAGRNILRLMREAETVAARLQSEREPSLATIEQLDGD